MLKQVVTSIIGCSFSRYFFKQFNTGLRVLALHDVPDARSFEILLQYINKNYDVVNPQDLNSNSFTHMAASNSVLLTFDDGYENVITTALPLLKKYGMKAILFVCPGIVTEQQSFWWDIAESGYEAKCLSTFHQRHATFTAFKKQLKLMADSERRKVIAAINDSLNTPTEVKTATEQQLKTWCDAGMILGNHTWDHPCLDRCTTTEQSAQIEKAHEWLCLFTGNAPVFFAYPNGDDTIESAEVLRKLGYEFAFLFDHKIAKNAREPFGISRLRLDASADVTRVSSILNGSHSFIYHRFATKEIKPQSV